MPEPTTVADVEAERAAEWGTYVATDRILIGGALAFMPGDAVPVSHVERDNAPVSKDLVARRNTKAAAAVLDDTTKG